ncbi:hypothetical protein [Saccharopolyspora cebuensis]|uniref:Uncharacterized protein n=1 Tax=Saccharopolyspora cebuensis TaxID=418759 RepID=A0ABV4CFU8_9PSEU
MTSPEHPTPAVLARRGDDGQAAVEAVEAAVAELDAVREAPVAEHVERFEAVHSALTGALSHADHLLSTTSGDRS